MLSPKEKAFRLNSRKETNWLIVSLIGFQYLLNLLHSWRIWRLDSIGCDLHGQLNSSLGKNLNRYSPIGAWFVIACVAQIRCWRQNCQVCNNRQLLFLLQQSALWNEKWLEKISNNLDPGENSLFKELKDRKIPLKQLLVLITELLIFRY